MIDNLEKFIESLKEYLLMNNLSVLELSQETNISKTNIYRWLSGDCCPSNSEIIKISLYTNLSCDYLFGLSDEMSKPTIPMSKVDFSILLRKLMQQKNVSASALSRACNFKRAVVSKWLNKTCQPRVVSLIDLANFFSCSLDSLIFGFEINK